MKQFIVTTLSILLMYSISFAGTPPSAVKNAFAKKFTNATKVSWGKESAKVWEAEFTFEGGSLSANFSEDGTWLETEKVINATDLPKAVSDAIALKYPGWTIAEADKTETLKHGTIYEADLKMGTKKKSVAFKENGLPVKE